MRRPTPGHPQRRSRSSCATQSAGRRDGFFCGRQEIRLLHRFTRNDRSAFLTLLSGARKRVASYRVREQSKTRARVYTPILSESVCGICTRSTTIWLCLSLSASVLLLPLRSSIYREQHAKKLTSSGVIGNHATLRDFASRLCSPGKTVGGGAMDGASSPLRPKQRIRACSDEWTIHR